MPKIFIVEDDENIRELVIYALTSSGFDAAGFENGEDFFRELNKTSDLPGLVLLDIMLPNENGLSILKNLRNNITYRTLPVIMLTAKSSEYDKVKGLDMGADDYIVKPFGVMELISRINAVMRRSGVNPDINQTLTYKNISLDKDRHTVLIDGEKVTLTYKEYELLHLLLLNVNIVLSRDKIMESVWGYDFEGESRTVDMHIKTLRHKLGGAGEHVKTIRNVGYKIGE